MKNNRQRTDRLGVAKAEQFFSSIGWLFREQFLHDYGIDAQVEIVDNEIPTGNLIAMQIKAGESYFKEQDETHVIFRTDNKHVSYWKSHTLPIILILYNPRDDTAIWQQISYETVQPTGKNWKISVPKNNVLSDDSVSQFKYLIQPPTDIRKLNRLRADKGWMELIRQGETVYLEFENWINKSLSRFQFTIGCYGRDDIEEESWPTTYYPGLRMLDVIYHVFPWADFETDEEAYVNYMEEVWNNECYSWRDSETGKIYHTQSFSEWYQEPDGIVPVYDNGETEGYRLILSLNNFGEAFLDVDDYLQRESIADTHSFSLD